MKYFKNNIRSGQSCQSIQLNLFELCLLGQHVKDIINFQKESMLSQILKQNDFGGNFKQSLVQQQTLYKLCDYYMFLQLFIKNHILSFLDLMIEEPKIQNMFNQIIEMDLLNYNYSARPTKIIKLLKNGDTKDNIILLIFIVSHDNIIAYNLKEAILQAFQSDIIWGNLNSSEKLVLASQLIDLTLKCKLLKNVIMQGLILGIKLLDVGTFFQIKDKIFNYYASPDQDFIEFGFQLLKNTFDKYKYQNEHLVIAKVFEMILNTDSLKLKREMVQFMNQIFTHVNVAIVKVYSFLGEKIIDTAFIEIQFENSDCILKILEIILEERSLFLFPHLTKFTVFCKNVYELPNYYRKREMIQNLEMVANKFPSYFNKNPNSLLIFLRLIFLEMLKIPIIIQNEWLIPSPNVAYRQQEDQDQEPILYGMGMIDRIFAKFNCQKLIEVFKYVIDQISNNSDWRYKYVSIMALSQIPEHITRKQYFTTIFQIIFGNINNPNPKIRYACFHALGQTVDDQRQIVHQHYFDLSIQKILEGFNDPVIRVKSHAFACFTNFAEKINQKKIQPYLNNILNLALENLQSNFNVLQQNVLGTLHQIFSIYKERVNSLNYLNMIIYLQQLINSPVKQVRCQVVETLSKLLVEIGQTEIIKPYVLHIQLILIKAINESDFLDDCYILNSWRKLIDKFPSYVFKQDPSAEKKLIDFISDLLVNTTDNEAIQSIFSLITSLISNTGAKDQQFYKTFEQIIENVLASEDSTGNKHFNVYNIYVNLIQKLQKTGNNIQTFYIYWNKYFTLLFDNLFHEKFEISDFNNDDIPHVQQALLKLLEIQNINLNVHEIAIINNKIKQLIKCALNNHKAICQSSIPQDKDEEEQAGIDQLLEVQEDIIQKALEIAKFMYEHYFNDQTKELIEYLCLTISPLCLSSNHQVLTQLGLFILDDIVQSVPYENISNIWRSCLELFLQYLTHGSHRIRQSSAFGISTWILKQKAPLNQENIQLIKSTVIAAMSIPVDQQNEREYYNAQDNVACIIGNLIKSNYLSIPQKKQYMWIWLDYLPLKKDKVEMQAQHNLLLVLGENQQLVRSKDQEGLQSVLKILKIIAKIYNTKKYSNKSIDEKIRIFLKSLYNDQFITGNSDFLWTNLLEQQKVILSQIQIQNINLG